MSSPKNDKLTTEESSTAVLKRVHADSEGRYTISYIWAFLLMGIVAAATAYPAWIVKDIVNEVFQGQNLELAYYIAITIFLVFSARGFATYGYMYILAKIANNMVARYQRRIFDHLLKLGVEYHKSTRSAFIVGRINQNILGMRNLLNDLLTVFARDLFTLIALLTVMIIQDPYMSILSLIFLPILAYIMSRYVRRMKKIARQEVDLNARVSSSLVENSQGMEIIKSFNMEGLMKDKMQSLTENAESQSNKVARLIAKTKPPTEIIAGMAIASVIAFGAYRVAEHGHDPGGLFSFLTAAMLAYDPARKLSGFRVAFERSIVNARMLYELIDLPPRQADRKSAKALKLSKGKIEIKNLHFAYHKDEPIIDNISLTAPAGKTTALIGPSGGGKSTIISLIQRFYDAKKGTISVDGQDIKKVTAHSLRENIAYVSQQPILFEGSILENIRYGRPKATENEIFEAAKLAQAHDFILEQPHGYDTPVGEMGANLSGGQRQRLSIARAFLRDAPILLLDEATSALDNESEKLVQHALDSLMKGRTTIVVAHRLSTIRNADRIYVIEDGKVAESGTHDALMKKKNGVYAKLHAIGNADIVS